jgi:hypothetical protein
LPGIYVDRLVVGERYEKRIAKVERGEIEIERETKRQIDR